MNNSVSWFLTGILTGFSIFGAIAQMQAPTREELQRELDAYRVCMASAGTTRCSMQPEDFVRYYEIEAQIRVMAQNQ